VNRWLIFKAVKATEEGLFDKAQRNRVDKQPEKPTKQGATNMAIRVKYSVYETTVPSAGKTLAEIVDQVCNLWDVDGQLEAFCPQGSPLDPDSIPEDNAAIILRNSKPAEKGV
jgi:hypothetical protein